MLAKVASELELTDCFEGFLRKPDLLLDDVRCEQWQVQELHPNEARSRRGDELLSRLSLGHT